MTLEILIFCHFFQRRLCWVLSSLQQQVNNPFVLTASIASLRGNGNPATEEVISAYRDIHGLTVRHCPIGDDKELKYRGVTRNRQVAESSADWLMFADADHVFPKNFFEVLGQMLEHPRNVGRKGIFTSSNKFTTDVDITSRVIENTDELYIPFAYEKSLTLPRIDAHVRHVAGGAMQLVRREHCEGYYVKDEEIADKNMFSYFKPRSDTQFRERFPQRTRFLALPPMVHLNHARDIDIGHHTEEQR